MASSAVTVQFPRTHVASRASRRGGSRSPVAGVKVKACVQERILNTDIWRAEQVTYRSELGNQPAVAMQGESPRPGGGEVSRCVLI